jgi:hypothetical protein
MIALTGRFVESLVQLTMLEFANAALRLSVRDR